MDTASITPTTPRKHLPLLVFQVGGQDYGLPSSAVQQVIAMAALHRPPGSPNYLAGYLRLAGAAVPVLRMHHLFGSPEAPISLWTPLIILRGGARRVALLVDDVQRIVKVDRHAVLPLTPCHALHDCVEGIVQRPAGPSLLLLSPERLLLRQEAPALTELQPIAQ